jgi:hypothetical protein
VQKYCKNVTVVHGSVTGLTTSADGSLLTLATVRTGDVSDETTLELSFFVDCTGPASAGSKWLSRIRPEWRDIPRDTYTPSICYSTGTYQLSPEALAKFESVRPASNRDLPSVRAVYASMRSGSPWGYGLGRGDDNKGRA